MQQQHLIEHTCAHTFNLTNVQKNINKNTHVLRNSSKHRNNAMLKHPQFEMFPQFEIYIYIYIYQINPEQDGDVPSNACVHAPGFGL